jgi:hypothetical protein
MINRNNRGGHTYRGIPYDPRPITVVDPAGRIWRTGTDEYRVARLSENGDTTLIIESQTPAPPVTEKDRSEYVDGEIQDDPEQRRVAEEIAELMPETKPMISSLTVDDVGRLWVGRTLVEGSRPVFDVFSADGEYLGSIELGFDVPSYMPIWVRHGQIYAVVRDSLEVPFVVRSGPVF